MKAVILSAGQGKRLLPITAHRPKCLIDFCGRPLLEWQIRSLSVCGVRDVVVVTGFGAEAVEQVVDRSSDPTLSIRTVHNPFFAVADNLGSCFAARGEMAGDFLLLNGDTLFEPAVLQRLLDAPAALVTATIDRKERYDDDDMKVQLDGRRLVAIGKTLPHETIDGESIGLFRFQGGGAASFVAGVEAVLRTGDGLGSWYLSVIDRLARSSAVQTVLIAGLDWVEVDFPADLRKAEELTGRWSGEGALTPRLSVHG